MPKKIHMPLHMIVMMRRSISLCICAAIIAALFAPVAMAAQTPTTIALAEPTITLRVAQKVSLAGDVTIEPQSASRSFVWKSSNAKVVTVSAKGTLTAKKAGVATITVRAKKDKTVSASCTVTVPQKTAMEYNPKKGNYKAGNNNVYGVRLNQSDLNKLKKEVDRVVAMVIKPGMKDYEKLNALGEYLTTKTTYQEWQKHRYNNTACGPLLRGRGACSGYARALKALCDAADLPCYYVHATFRDHQWNMVRLDGIWFHIDAQKYDDTYGFGPGGSAFLPGEAEPNNPYPSSLPPTYYDLIYPNGDPNNPVLINPDEYDRFHKVGPTYTFETAPRY